MALVMTIAKTFYKYEENDLISTGYVVLAKLIKSGKPLNKTYVSIALRHAYIDQTRRRFANKRNNLKRVTFDSDIPYIDHIGSDLYVNELLDCCTPLEREIVIDTCIRGYKFTEIASRYNLLDYQIRNIYRRAMNLIRSKAS